MPTAPYRSWLLDLETFAAARDLAPALGLSVPAVCRAALAHADNLRAVNLPLPPLDRAPSHGKGGGPGRRRILSPRVLQMFGVVPPADLLRVQTFANAHHLPLYRVVNECVRTHVESVRAP